MNGAECKDSRPIATLREIRAACTLPDTCCPLPRGGGGRLPAVLMRHPPSYLSKPGGGGGGGGGGGAGGAV